MSSSRLLPKTMRETQFLHCLMVCRDNVLWQIQLQISEIVSCGWLGVGSFDLLSKLFNLATPLRQNHNRNFDSSL